MDRSRARRSVRPRASGRQPRAPGRETRAPSSAETRDGSPARPHPPADSPARRREPRLPARRPAARLSLPKSMTKRIAVVGAGALGGYVGGSLAHLGHDVTLIDPWPEHVETIRARGLELDGVTPEERFVVRKAKTLHLTEVQALARNPVDVAMISVKSYDTRWATALIAVASIISVDLYEAGRIRRTAPKGGDKHTVFRIGEPHGRITPRVEELVEWFRGIDSSKATTNLWGERWSKLVQNAMGNPVTAATGLTTGDCLRNDAIRRFQIRLAGEAVRVGQALGYQLEKIRGVEPETMARASEGDARALSEVEALIVPKAGSNPR